MSNAVMFYTNDEIKNLISKNRMCGVDIGAMNGNCSSVHCKIGDDECEHLSAHEMAEIAFDGKTVSYAKFEDGGMLVSIDK